MSVEIFTRRYCSYCVRAKRLLDELGVIYSETSVDGNPQAYAEMTQRSRRTSVPQIWIHSEHIGGCDELVALYRQGQLERLLNQTG